MQKLLNIPGVDWQLADQCQYGLVTLDPNGVSKPKKSTRFVSNGLCVLEEFCPGCPGDHSHQSLLGGRAAASAEYPDDLCNAVCRLLVRQKQYERESRVVIPRRGRNELKHMLKRLTASHTTTGPLEMIDQAHVPGKPIDTQSIHACVEQDLDSFATRTG